MRFRLTHFLQKMLKCSKHFEFEFNLLTNNSCKFEVDPKTNNLESVPIFCRLFEATLSKLDLSNNVFTLTQVSYFCIHKNTPLMTSCEDVINLGTKL